MFKLGAKPLRRWLLASTVVGGALFALSGAWTDPWLWTYVALLSGLLAFGLLRLDEDLATERFHPPSAGADATRLRLIQFTALAHMVVGALDLGRWHLSSVPDAVRVLALAGMAAAGTLVFSSMHANRFFSVVVRIQSERGHHVVDRGPYARVRHPGYAGMIPLMALSGLALNSWPAFALGLVYGGLMLHRAVFEDAFLTRNLQGYDAYAARVRYRLVPGVW